MKTVLGDDKSDEVTEAKLSCIASIPDIKIKEEVWADIMDKNSKHSLS